MKSNSADPHFRTLTIPDIHQFVFETVLCNRLNQEEKHLQCTNTNLSKSSSLFNLQTLERVNQIFPKSPVKVHNSGDISLVTPWFVLNKDQSFDDHIFKRGHLVIPIKSNDEGIECFIPCAGLDPDTDIIPSWCSEKGHNIQELVPDISPNQLLPIRKHGEGTLTGYKSTFFASIKSGQVDIGDLIYCRGQTLEVFAISDDAFYPEGSRNSLRFTKDLTKNINRQKFDIIKWPVLQGKIVNFNMRDVDVHEPMSFMLSKISDISVGTLKISYQNACFNSFGFLTHDTHLIPG